MLSEACRNGIQTLSWLVASVGGVVAAFQAIVEIRRNREQTERQIRWEMVNKAKEFDDEVWGDLKASKALQMLDWEEREHEIAPNKFQTLTRKDVLSALRVPGDKLSDQEVYVRDCFDALFLRFGRQQHFIRRGLISFRDVRGSYLYYVKTMAENREVFSAFLEYYGYVPTLEFLGAFDPWASGLEPPSPTRGDQP